MCRRTATYRAGLTLIELMVGVSILTSAAIGAALGAELTGHPGGARRAGAMVVCAAGGGVAAIACLYLLSLPFATFRVIRRIREPTTMVCRCQMPGVVVPVHLLPSTPLEVEALEESHHWAECPEVAVLRLDRPPASDRLRAQLSAGELTEEQVSLAAALGESATIGLASPTKRPLLQYKHWAKLPDDLQLVLRAGLPPRLCMVWAMSCAVRALAEFECEFHQDKRPRCAFGLALLMICDGRCDALDEYRALFERRTSNRAQLRERGCRVLDRTLWERIRGQSSRGEEGSKAVSTLARAAADYIDPQSLWMVHLPGSINNAYMTAEHRCIWSLPCFHAEQIAAEASRSAASAEAEIAWQRATLARMILAWPRWEEDRQEWQQRVEEEWIPKVSGTAGLRFNLPTYVARIRRTFIPWSMERTLTSEPQ